MKFLALSLLPTLFFLKDASAQKIVYTTYCNDRFGYCIDYPKDLLKPQPEAQNGDGRIFTDNRGIEKLRVYGCREFDKEGNMLPLERLYKMELNGGHFHEHPNRKITYSKLGKGFYVISGVEKGNIFYEKVIQLSGESDDALGEAILIYSPAEKSLYDSVSVKIFNSFK